MNESADPARAAPTAAAVLGDVLEVSSGLPVLEAVAVESMAYSTLLVSAEFAAWLRGRPRRSVPPCDEPVRVTRTREVLEVVLNRPERRNALGASVREALLDAVAVLLADPTLTQMTLRGAGPDFCAGGDLDEFGTAGDPAAAHLVRMSRHPGLAVHEVADRVRPVLHGACIGAGIEVPAFASHVVAHPGTTFRLPELSMGLIPGAGGTVSITRRIGRARLEWWVRSGAVLDVATAREWGLIDEVVR